MTFSVELAADNPRVRLVRPDVTRDAPLSVQWLAGSTGRETLRLMGVPDSENHPTTIEAERQRIAAFLEVNDELDWMIQLDGKTIGAIWVHLKPTDEIAAPTISVMIGDPAARGQGVGGAALAAIIKYLEQDKSYPVLYARHLAENTVSENLLRQHGFVDEGTTYRAGDGLGWQNMVHRRATSSGNL